MHELASIRLTTNTTDKPTVTLAVGMAGAGKSSIICRLQEECERQGRRAYMINLDPAVRNLAFEPNIDVRDTIHYDGVREKYGLGPNGAILTVCNLFATRFHQVVSLCEQRASDIEHILVDTPGQIELFTWSASGAIISESFAASFSTSLLFVVDTPRVCDPQVFMSNMLQCLSIMYKTKLPIVLAFNKIDVHDHEFAHDWMMDSNRLYEALDDISTYASELSRALVTTITEFYAGIQTVGVSAHTNEGFEMLLRTLTSHSPYK